MNLRGLAADLRAAADMLERIADVFSPDPAPQAMPALSAPAIAETAPAPRRKAAAARKKSAKRVTPRKATRAAARNRGERVWTEARNDVLRRDWPSGVPTPEIRAALNRLPGPTIKANSHVAIAAGQLKLHRPDFKRRQPRTPPEDALPAPVPVHDVAPASPIVRPVPAPPRPPARPLRRPSAIEPRDGSLSVAQRQELEARAADRFAPITWADAMTWASRNKVPLGGSEEEDLAATNRLRRELQLAPYVIVDRRGPPERLPEPNVGGNYETAAA